MAIYYWLITIVRTTNVLIKYFGMEVWSKNVYQPHLVVFDHATKIIIFDKRNDIEKNEMFTRSFLCNDDTLYQQSVIMPFLVLLIVTIYQLMSINVVVVR